MIQGSNLYKYVGSNTKVGEWRWEFIKSITVNKTSTSIKYFIPISLLKVKQGSEIRYGLVMDDDWRNSFPNSTYDNLYIYTLNEYIPKN